MNNPGSKHIIIEEDKTTGEILNEDMYRSDCSSSTYVMYAIFTGFIGGNFQYAKYMKTYFLEVFFIYLGIIASIYFSSFIPIIVFLVLNYIISFTTIFFIYTDAEGRRFK